MVTLLALRPSQGPRNDSFDIDNGGNERGHSDETSAKKVTPWPFFRAVAVQSEKFTSSEKVARISARR